MGTGCYFIIDDTIDITISELVTIILMQRQMFDPLSKLAAMQSTISQSVLDSITSPSVIDNTNGPL